MDIVGIREALEKKPFEPFALKLADGRSILVPCREFVALNPRRIVVINNDGSWHVVEPLLIVSMDYDAPHKKGSNGSGTRKRPPKG